MYDWFRLWFRLFVQIMYDWFKKDSWGKLVDRAEEKWRVFRSLPQLEFAPLEL